MAETTANGKYRYDQVFHGASLSEWVRTSHAALAHASGWEYQPLRAGTFGHDNLAVSLAHMKLGEPARICQTRSKRLQRMRVRRRYAEARHL